MIDWSPGHLSNKIPKDFTQEAGDGHLVNSQRLRKFSFLVEL